MAATTLMHLCLSAYSPWKHSRCSTIWRRNWWRGWVFRAKSSRAEALPYITQMVRSSWKLSNQQSSGLDLQASLEGRLSSMLTVTRKKQREICSSEVKSNKWTLIQTQSWTQTLNSPSRLFRLLPTFSHSNLRTLARKVFFHRWAPRIASKLEAQLVMDYRR